MSLTVENATNTLYHAYNDACKGIVYPTSHQDFIDTILDNKHLTFKYVLFNALLSKATDENINPLCLQKHSKLPGSYDARTICHKVIVPFEKNELDKVFGGSNEPFLNKPARFPELSPNNAVRKGNDLLLLNTLCLNLPKINTSEEAYYALVYFLKKAIDIREKKRLLYSNIQVHTNIVPQQLLSFFSSLISKNFEGETLTLAVAGAYYILYPKDSCYISIHPVNESGASSKEISDLDIFFGEKTPIANELKDKIFSETDVCHAVDKAIKAGCNRMLFIKGKHAHCSSSSLDSTIDKYRNQNFVLNIINAEDFISYAVSIAININVIDLVNFLIQKARETKFKEETISYLLEAIKKYL